MSILKNIPENIRGWAYLAIFVVVIGILVAMFVIAVLNGDDLSAWFNVALGALGLGGSAMATANTTRKKDDSA